MYCGHPNRSTMATDATGITRWFCERSWCGGTSAEHRSVYDDKRARTTRLVWWQFVHYTPATLWGVGVAIVPMRMWLSLLWLHRHRWHLLIQQEQQQPPRQRPLVVVLMVPRKPKQVHVMTLPTTALARTLKLVDQRQLMKRVVRTWQRLTPMDTVLSIHPRCRRQLSALKNAISS